MEGNASMDNEVFVVFKRLILGQIFHTDDRFFVIEVADFDLLIHGDTVDEAVKAMHDWIACFGSGFTVDLIWFKHSLRPTIFKLLPDDHIKCQEFMEDRRKR